MAKELKQYVTSPQFMGNQILEQEDKVVKGLNVSDIRLPGILLAGVQKSGSTALDDFLSLQAGVCLSRPNPDIDKEKKEVHFYDNKELYSKGVPFYSSLFAHCDNMRHTADGTPNTFSFPERVKETYDLAGKTALEELKIVIVLREPVSRELSWYNHIAASCRTDIEGCNFKGRVLKNEPKAQFRTFTEYSDFVFDDYNIDGIPKWKQQAKIEGVYGEKIEQWFHHFDRKQILVLSYDELKENETSFLHRVLSFLGLYVDLAMIDSGTKHFNTHQSSSKVKLPSCDTQKKLAKMFKPSNDKLYQLIDDEKGEQPTEQQRPFPRFVLSNCTNHNDNNRIDNHGSTSSAIQKANLERMLHSSDMNSNKFAGFDKLRGERPDVSEMSDYPEDIQKLIMNAWDSNPLKRPTDISMVKQIEEIIERYEQSSSKGPKKLLRGS